MSAGVGTDQGVDISNPKCAKGRLSVEITGEPPLGSFCDRTLIQGRESEHIQLLALTLLRDVVCICFQREVLLCLPRVNESQPVRGNEAGKEMGKVNDVYM